jgi:hypothetical protein
MTKKALALIFTFACAVCLGIDIETERNNGWFLSSGEGAIRIGTEDYPGIAEEWIPQSGTNGYLRMTPSYSAVVASMMSAIGERKYFKSDAEAGDHKYVFPAKGLQRRLWDWINHDLTLSNNGHEPPIEETLVRVETWDGPDSDPGLYAKMDGLLKNFGSERLNGCVNKSGPVGVENVMSREWTTNSYLTAQYEEMWRNSFPTFGRCTNDVYFTPDPGFDAWQPDSPSWFPWLSAQYGKYRAAGISPGGEIHNYWQPLDVSIRDSLDNLSDTDLRWWRSDSARPSWTRMAIISELLADCQYSYEPITHINPIKHENIEYAPRFVVEDIASESEYLSPVAQIPVAFTVTDGTYTFQLGDIFDSDAEIDMSGVFVHTPSFDTLTTVTVERVETQLPIQSPRAGIGRPIVFVYGYGEPLEFDLAWIPRDLGEEWWGDYLDDLPFDWGSYNAQDGDITITGLGGVVGGDHDYGETSYFVMDRLRLKYIDAETGNETNIVQDVNPEDIYVDFSVSQMQYKGTAYLLLDGGISYSKPVYEVDRITDAEIILGFSDVDAAERARWNILERDSWFNWQCYSGDGSRPEIGGYSTYTNKAETRLQVFGGDTLQKLLQERCRDVRELSDFIWSETQEAAGGAPLTLGEASEAMTEMLNTLHESMEHLDVHVSADFLEIPMMLRPCDIHIKDGEIESVTMSGTGEEREFGKGIVTVDIPWVSIDGLGGEAQFRSWQNILRRHKWRFKNIRRKKKQQGEQSNS